MRQKLPANVGILFFAILKDVNHTVKQFKSERGCLSYIVADNAFLSALIIDPSVEVPEGEYIEYLKDEGLTLKFIIETHTHADHISSGSALKEATGAKILQHANAPSKRKDRELGEEDLMLGETKVTIIHTPGHTDDSICIALDDSVFTGDTLLIGGTGRTDFQNGSSGELYDSLWKKLMTLDANTIVYPGHNYRGRLSSTIVEEKESNARLLLDREEFTVALDAHHPPKPDLFDEAVKANSL